MNYHAQNAVNYFYWILNNLRDQYFTENKAFDPRLVSAYHEAGHTIIAINQELGFDCCEIYEKAEDGGETKVLDDLNPDENVDKYSCYLVAGIIAQYLGTGDLKPSDYCCDYIKLICLRNMDVRDISKIVLDTIKEIILEETNIHLLAAELFKKNKLYQEDLIRIGLLPRK